MCSVDVWFDIDRLDDVNNSDRRDAPWLVSVVVDVIWVEVEVLKEVGRPDVWIVVWVGAEDAVWPIEDSVFVLDKVTSIS